MSARQLSFDVLKKIQSSKQYSNIAIDRALEGCDLGSADKGLFTIITMGVIERRLTLDYFIDRLADAPDKIDSDTRILLRMGLYQLMFLDRIPDYAVINETVGMSPKRTKGFVNAVLRSYLRKKNGMEYPDKDKAPVEHISVKYSFPTEVSDRFIRLFGFERTCNIFESFNSAPDMTLRINTLKISREEYCRMLCERGIEYKLTENSPVGVQVSGMSFSSLPHAEDGYFFVQDEASQICVEAVGADRGDFLIDCCSCPGSKSFGSAVRMKNEGRILSCDLHKSKLSLVSAGAQRLGIDIISTKEADARKFDESLSESADIVLCDVPCSGFGVLAKKPEIRYKELSESDRLPAIQSDILENACRYVKTGGVLVYSTCTLFPKENQNVVDDFISKHKEFVFEDFSVGGLSSENGKLTLFPDIHKTDGFFVSKMRRI